jgi:hypothetical protein
MKGLRWQILLASCLVLISFFLYFIHYLIFGDVKHIVLYLIGDIAFLPVQVLIVTLIIDRVLSLREKREKMEKLYMVIGAFFSEAGTRLLTYFSDMDPNLDQIRKNFMVTHQWPDQEFVNTEKRLKGYEYRIDISRVDLEFLKSFLKGKRDFLVRLLENQNLLEHESFTDLLWAVFHLTEELEDRDVLTELPDSDLNHLARDMNRAYVALVHQWWSYMKHLKNHYPYLFSLAMRMNPFDQNASAIVR